MVYIVNLYHRRSMRCFRCEKNNNDKVCVWPRQPSRVQFFIQMEDDLLVARGR